MADVGAIVRQGRDADVASVLSMLQQAGLPTVDLATARDLRLWVLEAGPALVGAVGMERYGATALLRSLVVVPEHRRAGNARRLVERLERDARAAGVERLVLLTQTAEDFFRAAGYARIARREAGDAVAESAEFRSLCPASAVCMSKSWSAPLAD